MSWVEFLVPAQTDGAIVEKHNGSINASLKEAAARERFEKSGLQSLIKDPVSARKFFESEIGHWSKRGEAIGGTID